MNHQSMGSSSDSGISFSSAATPTQNSTSKKPSAFNNSRESGELEDSMEEGEVVDSDDDLELQVAVYATSWFGGANGD